MAQDTQAKSCCWSITINNPTTDDFQNWESLKGYDWVREVVGQMEKGDNETPHIQGMVKTKSVRFAQIKKVLPRAHIEAAKSQAALSRYVVKEETRIASIPTAKVATQSDIQKRLLKLTSDRFLRTDQELTKDRLYEWLNLEQLKNNKFGESLIDAAVKELLLEGYYGIEFVMSNPQVRTAFKKYFSEIIIREYGRNQDYQAPSPSPPFEGTQNEPPIQTEYE